MKTEITKLLGIEYPIVQGGMAWVAEYHLAAAVSNAGGLRKAVVDGDTRTGSLMAGQSAGLVKEECTCKEFIERITAEATALMGKKVD